jgi:hypothetical protein
VPGAEADPYIRGGFLPASTTLGYTSRLPSQVGTGTCSIFCACVVVGTLIVGYNSCVCGGGGTGS